MSNTYKSCELHFGLVPVGTTVTKSYPFKNNHHTNVTFYVTRNTQTNPIYYVFDVPKYKKKVQPGADFILKISYTPTIPGNRDFDYFTVTDTKNHFCHLSFKGECIGPSLSCSIRNLTFFKTQKRQDIKHIFTLTNNSTVSATFQFDCPEEEPGFFEVEPLKGTLRPHEDQYMTVRFVANKLGLYCRQLWCLILHHEPLLINLLGVSSSAKQSSNSYRFYPFPLQESVGFAGYMSDSVTRKRVPPPVSLTVNYLDFGRIMPKTSCQTLTTSFTNHMDHPVTVEWENVKLFQIYPERLEIPPKKSALYECRFAPDRPERLAATTLNGHVFWSSFDAESSSNNAPFPINVRFIGHSFPKTHVWIPSIKIVPHNVVLPLSLPNFSSYTTFMIQSLGFLPVLYKLVPPSKTAFVMKPMVGLIRNFQIVVVQLENKSAESTSYVETWNIEVNGQVEKSLVIYVKAQTDIPRIRIGDDNIISFESIQPGTQSSMYVPVRNVSICQLRYEFELIDQFEIKPSVGIIGPNEETFVTATYSSDLRENGKQVRQILCKVQCINNTNAHIGEAYSSVVQVVTEVIYTELCAIPKVYQCGEVENDTLIETCFYLYNFGESHVNFMLGHDHDLKDARLTPVAGKCGPKEKLMIKVEFQIRKPGRNCLHILYNNRQNNFSEELVQGEAKRSIFRIEYNCCFPTLQIVGLLEHSFGHLFSNDDLWRLLKIDEINSALLEVNQGEIKQVDLYVPEAEVSNKEYRLVFAIKNITNISTKLVLKRRQVCDCKREESVTSFTFRKQTYSCAHKKMLTIHLEDPRMPAQKIQTLTITVKHLLPLTNILSYTMEMTAKRTVILNISINSVPDDHYALSAFDQTYTMKMGNVFIGLREAPVFAFRLYNNANKCVSFKLDDTEMVKLCNGDDFPVLTCLNCVGTIEAQSTGALLFKFWPIEVKRYAVAVPLLLGLREVALQVEGYGTDQINKFDFTILSSLSPKPLRNKMISLSIDRLVTEPILVSSFTERLFFINNHSKTEEIKYLWKPCFIDGLVNIEPMTVKGVLRPTESHPVVIKIQSMNEPCCIRILFCCELVSKEELLIYQDLTKRRSSLKEFTISETMEIRHSVEVPEPEFFHISLPITLNIIGILDRDTCIKPEDQLKLQPVQGIDLDVNTFLAQHFERTEGKERPIREESNVEPEKADIQEVDINKEITQTVLEQVISDAVFSEYFRQMLTFLKTQPSPLYSQIRLNDIGRDEQRKAEIERFFTKPKLQEVTRICEEAVLDSLQLREYETK